MEARTSRGATTSVSRAREVLVTEVRPARLAPTRRTHPIDISSFVSNSLAPVAAVLGLLLAFVLVVLFLQERRIRRLQGRLADLTRGESGDSLEGVLGAHLGKVTQLGREVDLLAARTAVLEQSMRRSFQRVGLVRFNPFEDTGGNQSFAFTLLDADDDGVVVSSLHGRNGTRIYAKAISHGRSEGGLSGEEAKALELARNASFGRSGLAERAGRG